MGDIRGERMRDNLPADDPRRYDPPKSPLDDNPVGEPRVLSDSGMGFPSRRNLNYSHLTKIAKAHKLYEGRPQ